MHSGVETDSAIVFFDDTDAAREDDSRLCAPDPCVSLVSVWYPWIIPVLYMDRAFLSFALSLDARWMLYVY